MQWYCKPVMKKVFWTHNFAVRPIDMGNSESQDPWAQNRKLITVGNLLNDPRHEIYNNLVCATSKASDQPAHMRSLIRAFASRLNIL